jgi:hypothetical protein
VNKSAINYYGQNDSIDEHYESLNFPQVYLKVDNKRFNVIPINLKQYYAGLFCDLRKLRKDDNVQTISN